MTRWRGLLTRLNNHFMVGGRRNDAGTKKA
jgi:hypothetical protein